METTRCLVETWNLMQCGLKCNMTNGRDLSISHLLILCWYKPFSRHNVTTWILKVLCLSSNNR